MVWTMLAIAIWMALGAAVALLVVVLRGRALWRRKAEPVVYGEWLGRECLVLKGDGWRRCRIVAVSWRGAVAVRNVTDASGRHAKWISKDKVPERMRWVGDLS